jgi:hypothetical protein
MPEKKYYVVGWCREGNISMRIMMVTSSKIKYQRINLETELWLGGGVTLPAPTFLIAGFWPDNCKKG